MVSGEWWVVGGHWGVAIGEKESPAKTSNFSTNFQQAQGGARTWMQLIKRIYTDLMP